MRMVQCTCVNLEQPAPSTLQELSANSDRFRNELAQSVAAKGVSIGTDQQKLGRTMTRDKDGRNPSTQTARRAVAVNLPLTGIHHSQVALAIDDFTGHRHRSQVASRLLECRHDIGYGDGAG